MNKSSSLTSSTLLDPNAQHINLYLSMPHKETPRLPAKMIQIIVIIFFCLLLLIYGYGFWQKITLRKQVSKAQEQVQLATQRLTKISQKYAKSIGKMPLTQQVSTLEKEVQTKSKIVSIFQSQAFAIGFSKYLTGLSKLITPKAWLTNIDITFGGDHIALQGYAFHIKDVLTFLNALNKNETYFKGKKFRIVKVQKGDKKEEPLSFIIRSREEAAS